MIICAGDVESFSFAKPIGIGMVNSAINLTELILSFCPSKLVFIGSAGSYGTHNIFDIVSSKSAANIELSFLENKSYSPIDNVLSLEENFQNNIVNSSNYITTDFNIANMLNQHKITLENMEFYSVLNCARKFNINAIGYFIITNFCDKNAHADFLQNHKQAMQYLIKHLVDSKIVSRETFEEPK